ncbi:hypothetical protein [Aliiglaciecola sp. M165]|uniref:hypothetical protein n=1 Tax=Aliiglaciecola sp. M165 TaxID=2593649 RepID=UPI00117C02D8|nr:hypothetical protein [Aliiglaciecola sp. M165]TRY30729.1 hypothetical protein FM019_12625 [Aliiglaciecola sp. M165]
MKKCELLPVLDRHQKRLEQAKAIGNLVVIAGGNDECLKSDLCDSVSVVCDLLEELSTNGKTISEAVARLYVVNDAVSGR